MIYLLSKLKYERERERERERGERERECLFSFLGGWGRGSIFSRQMVTQKDLIILLRCFLRRIFDDYVDCLYFPL